MARRLQAEQEHQKRAFELYHAQGGKRSHEKVARELGVSVATVKAWSRSFNWAKRLAERDAAVARQVADQTLKSEVDELDRNKKIVQMALLKVAKAINADKVKVQVGDLDRLIRLQTFLAGDYIPVTLESLNRMPPLEVALLLETWLSSLSDEVLTELIASLRRYAQGGGNAGPSISLARAESHEEARQRSHADGSVDVEPETA